MDSYNEVFDLREIDENITDDKEHYEDPLHLAGFGVFSYLDTLLSLAKMYGIITLLCIPIYIMYVWNNY